MLYLTSRRIGRSIYLRLINQPTFSILRLYLSASFEHPFNSAIQITGSKSESNRLLLLKALYPNIQIENLSNSDDSNYMIKGLKIKEGNVDIHHAGTAMRFLTAFFASRENIDVILTGSERMQQRPISILVDALKDLGADISYVNKEGYPPISIKGQSLQNHKTSLPANVSSQYISALLLIAPSLANGLELELIGEITSVPYIRMTCALLTELGIQNSFEGNLIKVTGTKEIEHTKVVVESDWSSASYFYSIAALAPSGTEIRLSSYREKSLQGDSILKELYRSFGVETKFEDQSIILSKLNTPQDDHFKADLANAPDLAQTIAVCCFGLGMGCELSGLHTLKIKETDRLEALQKELTKLGADIKVTKDSLFLSPSSQLNSNISIDTYNDHRMAMAFAPLALKTPIYINNAEVVSKSYPDFWEDLKSLGILIKED